jgi:hypothetical protein
MNSSLTFKGYWWLPSNPEIQVSGELVHDPETGTSLKLMGCLGNDDLTKVGFRAEIILGFSVCGKKLTLLNTWQNQLNMGAPGMPTSEFVVNSLFIGEHYTRIEDILFNRIVVQLKNLPEWLNISGFKIDNSSNSTSISYTQPPAISFTINEFFKGEFTFAHSTHYAKNPSIEETISLVISSTDEERVYTYSDFLEMMYAFQMLLTFSTFSASFPLKIEFYSSAVCDDFFGKKVLRPVKLINTIRVRRGERDVHSAFMLFNYIDIKENFQNIINNWIVKLSYFRPAINLYLNPLYNDNLNLENSFINMAQAIEYYHRKVHTIAKTEMETHKKKIRDIITSVDTGHKKWLKEKLAFSHEPTLLERINDLLTENSNATINRIIPDHVSFAKQVKDTRNYYTHFSVHLKNKRVRGEELYYLTEKLKALLTCCILHIVGFNNEKIEELLLRNEYRFFNHLIKPISRSAE